MNQNLYEYPTLAVNYSSLFTKTPHRPSQTSVWYHPVPLRQGGRCFVQAGRRGSLATASVWVTYMVAWTPHKSRGIHPELAIPWVEVLICAQGGRGSQPSKHFRTFKWHASKSVPWSDSGTGLSAEHFPRTEQCSTCPFVGLQLQTVLVNGCYSENTPLISGWTLGLHTKELHCATRYLGPVA